MTRIRLRTLLVLPFVIEVCGFAGLMGYLSYRSAQEAISELAQQLIAQTAEQVTHRLDDYIHTPAQLVSLNTLATRQGSLDVQDSDSLETELSRQIRTFRDVTDLTFISPTGQYIAVERDRKGDLTTPGSMILSIQDQQKRQSFVIDKNSQRKQLLQTLPNWEPRNLPWYQYAIAQPPNTQSWTAIYPSTERSVVRMKIVSPVYRNGELIGVFGSGTILFQLSLFLSNLPFSPNGHIFIMERSGELVATSTREQLFTRNTDNKALTRLAAIKSRDWLIRTTTEAISEQTQDLTTINTTQSLQFTARPPDTDSQRVRPRRYFTKVIPYSDQYGLDWLIVLTVPETDFMGNIYKNIHKTAIVVAVALVGVMGLGVYTAKWINQPIIQLQKAVSAINQNNFSVVLPQTPLVEIQHLSYIFAQMQHRLSESFQGMKLLNQQLFESEARLQKFLECLPIGVAIHAATGQVIYMNSTGKKYLQKEISSEATLEEQAEYYQVYIAGTDIPYPPEKLPAMKALAGEFAQTEDLEIRTTQNHIILEVQATPLLDDREKVTYAIVTFQDITTRKKAEDLEANYNRELQKQVNQRTQALANANIKLEQLAQTDALTQVANRRKFDGQLKQEWRRLHRSKQPLSLLLIDIDYFKRYNDRYGHQQGDLCLFKVAQALKQAIYRVPDFVARYGGEEFVVVLPETDKAGAVNIAKRIQARIAALNIPHQDSEVSDRLTLSIGISSLIPTAKTLPKTLIAAADKALYSAKDNGRNCYKIASLVTSKK
ncbi:MAG: diguanylate cyclase [Microcoleaceae cyanobacterium]